MESSLTLPVVLSIGTTHPRNVAGLGLDLMLAHELGIRVMTVVTAVSAQDDRGIQALATIDEETVRAQLASVPREAIHALRVGALTSPRHVELVADYVRELGVPAVVDPVAGATLGGLFAGATTITTIRARLATLSNVILTPNLREAALLIGRDSIDRTTITEAAVELLRLGARAVLLKGGHLHGDPVDVLSTAREVDLFTESRLPGEMPGTGCTLAIALASELAKGTDLRDAVIAARSFVRRKIHLAASLR
jgi:hydroxymethylpyrimidine/phosphomethylpyrimidine kinase